MVGAGKGARRLPSRLVSFVPVVASLGLGLSIRLHPLPDMPTVAVEIGAVCAISLVLAGLLRGLAELRPRGVVAFCAALSVAIAVGLPHAVAGAILRSTVFALVLAAPLVAHIAWGCARLTASPARVGGDFKDRCGDILSEFIPRPLARLVASELMVLWYAVVWRRVPAPEGTAAFSYHQNMRPILWALLGASVLEIGLAHLLVWKLWSPRAAVIVSLLSEFGVVYLIGVISSLDKLPILITPEGVLVRAGLLVDHLVPFAAIASARCVTDCGDTRRKDFLRASLLAYPNVLLDLEMPRVIGGLGRGRAIATIGLRPDDAPALVQAIRQAKARALRPSPADIILPAGTIADALLATTNQA